MLDRSIIRPLLSGGITAALVFVLELKVRESERELKDKSAAFAATPGVDLWNPLTWGNAPREFTEDLELKRIWLFIQAFRSLEILVAIIGGAATLYFVWQDLIKTPAQREQERMMAYAITTEAVRAAIPAAVVAGTGGAAAPAYAPLANVPPPAVPQGVPTETPPGGP